MTKSEITFWIEGTVSGAIPDYQIAAMLMAIYFQGMDQQELTELTMAMAESGDQIDLSEIKGFTVDKHSTGGVGDKTTLIVAPIVASLGVKVAKMSGRGLGHTGGTIDKLEAIPGFQTTITTKRFFEIVNQIGVAVIGQTGDLVPADKKLYALRDVTATVDSLPLIAASIMSKKLAAGSKGIVLDVKTGSGAFMKTTEESITLAREMVAIAARAGRKCCALVTDMDIPLGKAIGNGLEVAESVRTLMGEGPKDLTEVSLQLAAQMLFLAGQGSLAECYMQAEATVADGRALAMLMMMVEAQGGDSSYIKNPKLLEPTAFTLTVKAIECGYVTGMDAQKCGTASVLLGAGRSTKTDVIDSQAGIVLHKKYGDKVMTGDSLATLYSSNEARFLAAQEVLYQAYQFGTQVPEPKKLIYEVIT